jgi:hypothetical protein
VWLTVTLLGLGACQQNPLDKALGGTLPLDQSNEIITEYCQSCHIHRAFDPDRHTPRMHALYDRPPYTSTTECRACHLVNQDTWGMRRRKTLWPAQVAQQKRPKS